MNTARKTLRKVKDLIRHGANYPAGILLDDCGVICLACARKEYSLISEATYGDYSNGWQAVGVQLYYEPTDDNCAHCNKAFWSKEEDE